MKTKVFPNYRFWKYQCNVNPKLMGSCCMGIRSWCPVHLFPGLPSLSLIPTECTTIGKYVVGMLYAVVAESIIQIRNPAHGRMGEGKKK